MFRSGKQNRKADALTRREQETGLQDAVKSEYRTRAFLSQDQIDARVLKDLGINISADNELALIEDEQVLDESTDLTDRILRANREAPSLQALRAAACRSSEDESYFTLEDGLLLYDRRLVVPSTSYLQTELIKEAYKQVSTTHPGRDKTYRLLRPRYY